MSFQPDGIEYTECVYPVACHVAIECICRTAVAGVLVLDTDHEGCRGGDVVLRELVQVLWSGIGPELHAALRREVDGKGERGEAPRAGNRWWYSTGGLTDRDRNCRDHA